MPSFSQHCVAITSCCLLVFDLVGAPFSLSIELGFYSPNHKIANTIKDLGFNMGLGLTFQNKAPLSSVSPFLYFNFLNLFD